MEHDIEAMLAEEASRWDEQTAEDYDTPGTGMFEPGLLDTTSAFLMELAGQGKALEFGIGTGRVAIPLMEKGVEVHGIDLSEAMVARLRQKANIDQLPVAIGDMTTIQMPDRYKLVYVVFNSISNLLTPGLQTACFMNAAQHLQDGGRFVVELLIPQLYSLPPGQNAIVTMSGPGYYCVDSYDILKQGLVSHHFYFGEGKFARIFRSKHRYIWPAELDLMAQLAGFTLENRYADWLKTPFTAHSTSQIAVYKKLG